MQYLERNFRDSNESHIFVDKSNDAGAEESLEATLLTLVRKKKHSKKIEQVIQDSGRRILTDCDTTLLLKLSKRYRSVKLFGFILDSKPKSDVAVPDLESLVAASLDEDWPTVRKLFNAHLNEIIVQIHGYRKRVKSKYDDDADRIEQKEESWAMNVIAPRILSELLDRGSAIERIAGVFRELYCELSLIVGLGSVELTKAYMHLRQLQFDSYVDEPAYRLLVSNVDVPQLQLFLDYNYNLELPWVLTLNLLQLLMKNASELSRSEVGRSFVKTLLRYDLFDDDLLQRLEPTMTQVSRENLEAFLQYDFRSLWKSKTKGRDVLASAFGNCDPEVLQVLKNQVDVDDARGFDGLTPLHFAAQRRAVESVRFLLGRGADPNAKDDFGSRPLGCAYGCVGDKKAIEECVRLLLIWGADPLLVYRSSSEIRYPQFAGVYARHLPKHRQIVELFLAEIAVREALGRSVEGLLESCRVTMGESFTDDFYGECRRQIDELKTHRIRDSSIFERDFTMFTLFSGREDRGVRWTSRDDRRTIETFMRRYESDESIMPYYYEVLKNRIRMIDRMNIYIDTAKGVLCESMKLCDSDHLVIRKILNYVTLKDILMCA